jgi:hypothetical protein
MTRLTARKDRVNVFGRDLTAEIIKVNAVFEGSMGGALTEQPWRDSRPPARTLSFADSEI